MAGPRAATATLIHYLRSYVFAPRYPAGEQTWLWAADGTRLAAIVVPGPADAEVAVVLAHGFANWSRTPAIRDFAVRLSRRFPVVVPDLRGHGHSGGRCTFSVLEPLDVAAAAGAARTAAPGLPVVTIGISMGGAAALLYASGWDGVAGTVAVSAPAWWAPGESPGTRRIQKWTSTPWRRRLLAWFLRTRVDPDHGPVPMACEGLAVAAPAFTILVHDPEDQYFGPEHPLCVFEEATEPKELWWTPGGGHGIDLLTPDLADRLLEEIETRAVLMALRLTPHRGAGGGPNPTGQGWPIPSVRES